MPNIKIYDQFSPEDTAMLQALYSRSPLSVEEHVKKVETSGSGKFMETFYIGYGHSSIGDCGSTTIFIENISILADKAIQDWPMYSGQETSTRYVDMSKQPISDPLNTRESQTILKNWMDFYIDSQEAVKQGLRIKHPKNETDDQKVYDKAINAKCFDIMRAFLPAGIQTQLSWHSNLRQAYDKLCWLRNNPLPEVKTIAEQILDQLKEKYPHSFNHQTLSEQEQYWQETAKQYNFYFDSTMPDYVCSTNIKTEELNQYKDILANRPAKTCLPPFLSDLGTITFKFLLDYGSFRDIQRHRNGVCRMPLLTTKLDFNNWYLEQLPIEVKTKALKLIDQQKQAIELLDASDEIKQYYIALGFNVSCKNTYGLMAAVYTTELRSNKTVHPTLRKIAHRMHASLKELFPNLVLHSDLEPSDWDIKRGTQDIVEKKVS